MTYMILITEFHGKRGVFKVIGRVTRFHLLWSLWEISILTHLMKLARLHWLKVKCLVRQMYWRSMMAINLATQQMKLCNLDWLFLLKLWNFFRYCGQYLRFILPAQLTARLCLFLQASREGGVATGALEAPSPPFHTQVPEIHVFVDQRFKTKWIYSISLF